MNTIYDLMQFNERYEQYDTSSIAHISSYYEADAEKQCKKEHDQQFITVHQLVGGWMCEFLFVKVHMKAIKTIEQPKRNKNHSTNNNKSSFPCTDARAWIVGVQIFYVFSIFYVLSVGHTLQQTALEPVFKV